MREELPVMRIALFFVGRTVEQFKEEDIMI